MENTRHSGGLALLRALRVVASQADDQSRALSDETGLTLPQLLCMQAIVDATERATVASVSTSVRLAPSTVSGILDRLERSRLVRRKRNSRDRRQVNLTLTARGEVRLAEVPDLRERLKLALHTLDDSERDETVSALKAVVAMLEGNEGHAIRLAQEA